MILASGLPHDGADGVTAQLEADPATPAPEAVVLDDAVAVGASHFPSYPFQEASQFGHVSATVPPHPHPPPELALAGADFVVTVKEAEVPPIWMVAVLGVE